ncbi:MAG: leucine-rich repeat protein, partial [Roseburia sp.]|nr:leucine-rich repeat protein [Roseburia sp.]
MIQINNKTLCEYCFEETDREPCPHCGYSREAYVKDPTVLAVGNILENRYIVGGVIGKGGFGITYLAYDRKLERKVAVKEYYPYGLAMRNLGSTFVSTVGAESVDVFKSGADKFYDEARLVAKFNDNPNIVSVYDFFYGNDTVYFTMGFLKGQTLKSYIRDHGVLTAGQTVRVAMDVTNALLAAHHLNVLHRDISPDNIMVCSDGTIKLLDFGAARQVLTEGSQSLSVILKQGFAPLEQYQKKGKQGPWTDIYALGATLYYALTLDLLDDPMSRLEDDSEYSSNVHNIDAPLWEVIRKATMLKSSERYRDIRELQEALEALPVHPEPLPMSEASVDKVKYELAAQTVHGLSGMAETVGYVEAGGATMPVSGTAGATMPLREETGATMPVSETAGVTQALREEAGVTMPVSEPGPVAQGQSAEPISGGKDKAAEEPHRETGGIQTSVTEEPPTKKKRINRKVLGCIAAVAGVLAVVLLVWLVRFLTADFRYKAYSDYVVITEYRGNDDEVEIPSEINGKPVTEIGEWAFRHCSNLMSVIIPSGVTEIGRGAFHNCSSLTSVEIPDSVTEIGEGAFRYCGSLTSIEIPNSVTKIGEEAFYNCTGLTSMEIPESVTEIGEKAFAGCTGLTSVTIPEHTTVAEDAFEDCPNVTITRAGSAAAADLEETPASSFEYGMKNNGVIITKYIGSETEVVIPREIDGYPVVRLADHAFWDCYTVTSIIIPESVTEIGESEFEACSALASVTIPSGVTSIPRWAFTRCNSLTSVTLPEGVTSIGRAAFSYCDNLTSVIIPESVTEIDEYAFSDCPKLTDVAVPEHTKVAPTAFEGTPMAAPEGAPEKPENAPDTPED